MKKILLTALIAATALPAMAPTIATAQTREWRNDRHDDRHDARPGRQDDWRDYRARNRAIYARGNWRAPFAYQRFRAGSQLRPAYYGSRYYIDNPGRYRLPAAGGVNRWVRHYDDALLVNVRTGRVVQVINGFFW